MKNNEVIAEKPFQNSGVTRCLAVLNRRSSSIYPSSYYYYYYYKRLLPTERAILSRVNAVECTSQSRHCSVSLSLSQDTGSRLEMLSCTRRSQSTVSHSVVHTL